MENKKYKTTILLLIILILLILYFLRIGVFTEKRVLVPTGKTDVFDIAINCKCEEKEDETCVSTDKNNNPIPVYNEQVEEQFQDFEGDVLGNVYVGDQKGEYVYLQKLEIFKNAAFQNTEKIAPGSSNTYEFVVRNDTDARIKYDINITETNNKNIGMLYRLKRNDSYVISNWVRASELKNIYSTLSTSNEDTYQLEWQWPYEGNNTVDTIAGSSIDSIYKLNIKVDFRAIV